MKATITDLFLKRPVLAVVINLMILVVGWRAIDTLPVRQYPRIESSALIIRTIYYGASAETIKGFVTTPLERAVSAIDGIDYVESKSIPGVSEIKIRLRLNHDSNDALAEVSARLQQVRSELPSEAEPPSVEIQRADRPYATFYISFISDTLSSTQLTEYLNREIRPELATLPGVQRSGIEAGRMFSMRVWLDPDKLASLGISPSEVESALRRNNFLAAVGRTKGETVQLDLLTNTDLRSAEEFERLIVREQDGSIIRLADVARIERGSEEPTATAGEDGKDAVFASVWPLPQANEIDVARVLRRKLAQMEPRLPADVKMNLSYDGTVYMENAIEEITKTLLETVLIVALIVFLFMGSFRTALVPLVAIPVSLIGAVVLMAGLGFSINLLTILAIVLAVGLVVDDAIVVVENIERHVRSGMKRLDAAITAGRELTGPVIAMTITLAGVYAPIGFQGGLTGVLFREFAFALAAAVLVSGVVALTLSPLMSARLVHEEGHEGRFTRWVNRRFDSVRNGYVRVLEFTLGMRATIVVASLIVIVVGVPLYMFSAKELAPVEDQGAISLFMESGPDSSLKYTEAYAKAVAETVSALPEKDKVWQITMSSGGFGGMQTVPWKERDRSVFEMVPEIFGRVSAIPGVRVFPMLPPPLPGAGDYDVEFIVTANDDTVRMAESAQALVQASMQSGLFMFADTDLKIDMPQVHVEIDRVRVADLGLDLADVGHELAVLLAGGYVNRFSFDGWSYKVIPQLDDAYRADPQRLLDLKITGRNGSMLPISAFTSIEIKTGPRSLNRFQQRDAFKIYGGVNPGVTKEMALSALEDAAAKLLPQGYAIDYAGESRQIRTEGDSLALTLGFAVILIYLILAAQFGSFRDPFIVLLGSVPLALSGALVFSFVGLTTINIYSQVGLITLVGLVAKNGILIVEFANTLQNQGRSKLEAVRIAATQRLRPILMTTAATVCGHFPLVLVTGAGAAARNSIGIVLVSGMLIGTFFTLFVVPSIYMLIAAKRERVSKEKVAVPTQRVSPPDLAAAT